jgi:hypothetical protein
VYEGRGHRVGRRTALVLLTVGLPLFVWSRDCPRALLAPAPGNALEGVLLALGVGLLLLPDRLTGVAPATPLAALWQVVRTVGGTWLLALGTAAYVLALRCGTAWSPAGVALAVLMAPALSALPLLTALPWRGLAAGLLIAAAWRGVPFCLA